MNADFAGAVRLDPEDARAFYDRGYADERMGQPAGAVTGHKTGVELDPDYQNPGETPAGLGVPGYKLRRLPLG